MEQQMTRFNMFRRANGVYYVDDKVTGGRESLGTRDRAEAVRLAHAKNEASAQPSLNRHIARAYLLASEPEMATRTWLEVMEKMLASKEGQSTHGRWQTAVKDRAFDPLRRRPLLETKPEHLLDVLRRGTVSTNVFLRRLHNFALDMDWLLRPVLPKRQWPSVTHKPKRAISEAEHERVIGRETNPERRAFYQLCWHLGGSQSDIASLSAEAVDWEGRTLTYTRSKTAVPCLLQFGETLAALLRTLPRKGPLFPYLCTVRESDRATEFKQRCQGLGIEGVTLHSYRYSWAERAKKCAFPERFAQQALGHSSKAVHRAYASKAEMLVPSLEDYESRHASKVVALNFQAPATPGNADPASEAEQGAV